MAYSVSLFFYLSHKYQAMMNKLYEIYKQCGSISTDTRNIAGGSLFFALKGDNFDANEMVEQALENGAGHVVSSNRKWDGDSRVTIVDDTLKTLQELASFHRSQLSIPIIGITGTNGKTTTKELVNAVLSSQLSCYATKGNLNNHIGVPLSLLSIKQEHEIAVIEMGANHPGEIAFLCSIARPTHGLITNVGKAHLEGFGSFEGVKRTKKELYDHLKECRGTVFINSANTHLAQMLGNYDNVFRYCVDGDADVVGEESQSDNDFLNLRWRIRNGQFNRVKTNLLGGYNIENVLAAIAVGTFFNVSAGQIDGAVTNYFPSNNRSQKIETGKNVVFMDAYNANPSSMALSIGNFAKSKGSNKVLVIGGMKELGADSEAEHLSVLQQIVDCGFSDVVLVGKEFGAFAGRFGKFRYFDSTGELCDFLQQRNYEGMTVLVKGSRSNQLEKTIPLF